MTQKLPKSMASRNIADQIFRSASSVAANYRATIRSRSNKEFTAKLGVVIEECDETLFWLQIIGDLKLLPKDKIEPLLNEVEEILKIMVATKKSMNSKF